MNEHMLLQNCGVGCMCDAGIARHNGEADQKAGNAACYNDSRTESHKAQKEYPEHGKETSFIGENSIGKYKKNMHKS